MAKASEWIERLVALAAVHGDLEVVHDVDDSLDLPEYNADDFPAFVTGS